MIKSDHDKEGVRENSEHLSARVHTKGMLCVECVWKIKSQSLDDHFQINYGILHHRVCVCVCLCVCVCARMCVLLRNLCSNRCIVVSYVLMVTRTRPSHLRGYIGGEIGRVEGT